jgi:hypothetical protein
MSRRNTPSADSEAQATSVDVACRRGESLGEVPAEAVEEKARAIRPRPRVGLGRSGDGKGARELMEDPIAGPLR